MPRNTAPRTGARRPRKPRSEPPAKDIPAPAGDARAELLASVEDPRIRAWILKLAPEQKREAK